MDTDTFGQIASALGGGVAAWAAAKVEISWLKKSRNEMRDTIKKLFDLLKEHQDAIGEIQLKVGILDATKDMTKIKR